MAQLQDTAGDLRRVANFLKGITAAADVIERIGSLENATAEAKAALAVAERDRDSALAELADAKAKGKAAVASAQAKADKILADAEAAAKEKEATILAEADSLVSSNLSMASQQAGEMVAKATAAAQTWEQTVADLMVKSQALAAETADLEAKRALAQAEFDKLTKALDALKAKFKIGD